MGIFSFFKKKKAEKDVVYSPAKGILNKLDVLEDGVFSEKMLGDGFVVTETNGMIYSPISGELKTLFATKHAYGIKTKSGLEVLVHIGIDTVSLNGEGFTTDLTQGQMVKKGQLLAKVDLELINKHGLNPGVIVTVTKESLLQPKQIRTEGAVDLDDVIISEFQTQDEIDAQEVDKIANTN